jgi:hypothetical protein
MKKLTKNEGQSDGTMMIIKRNAIGDEKLSVLELFHLFNHKLGKSPFTIREMNIHCVRAELQKALPVCRIYSKGTKMIASLETDKKVA